MDLKLLLAAVAAVAFVTPADASATLAQQGSTSGTHVTYVSGGPYLDFTYSGGTLNSFDVDALFSVDYYWAYPETGSYDVTDDWERAARITPTAHGFLAYAGDSFYHPCTGSGLCIEEKDFEGYWLIRTDFSSPASYSIWTSNVPEPATWAMMLIGLGAIGVAMRRQRRTGAKALMAA